MNDRYLSAVRDNSTTDPSCRMLSTVQHRQCPRRSCDCTCHQTGAFGGVNTSPRRPHSFPRPDWAEGKRPKHWKEEKAARKRQEALLGIVGLD